MATVLFTWQLTATPPVWAATLSASSPPSQWPPFSWSVGRTWTVVTRMTTGLFGFSSHGIDIQQYGCFIFNPFFCLFCSLSPLHIAATNGYPDIMNLLISCGAHFDSTNAFQQTACDLLDEKELSKNVIQPINHTTLQCLAARAIIKHSLDYRGNIPEKLEAFVSLHR